MLKIDPAARQRVKEMAQHARRFPNVGIAGHYDPFTQVIILDSIEERHLRLVAEQNDFGAKKSYVPLLAHEVRHWFDHIGTVWGRRQLVAVYNAMNARAAHGPEEYYRIPRAFRELTLDAYPRYFSTVTDDPQALADRRTWLYQTTSGQRFSYDGRMLPNSPILFSRFATQDEKHASRCPFSVDSLLETGAVWDEMQMMHALISTLQNEGRLIEEKQWVKESLERLYNPELAKYSVAVHAIANALRIKDSVVAFNLSSLLGGVCLNLPDAEFDRLVIPERFNKEGWSHLHPHYVAQRDRGYLFVSIALHGAGLPYDDAAKWVDAATAAAGLGGLAAVSAAASAEMSKEPEILAGPFQDRLKELLRTGEALFRKRGVTGNLYSVGNAIRTEDWMPPVILGDDHVLRFGQFKDQGAVNRLFDRINEFWEIERAMKEFVDACGV